jgi:uncharacterized protein YlaI
MKCGICEKVKLIPDEHGMKVKQFTGIVFGRNQICMPCIEKLMKEEIRRNNND